MTRNLTWSVSSANPNPQPRILTRAQMLLNGLKPVMATTTAAWPQPDLPQGQIRIVHHDQQPRKRDPIKIYDCGDCLAARIHECLRPAKQRLTFISLDSREARIEFLFSHPVDSPAFTQLVDNDKTDVVTGPGILAARVSKPNDQVQAQANAKFEIRNPIQTRNPKFEAGLAAPTP